MISNNLPDEEITYKIIGCAMKVHTILRSGFQEVIYQRALAEELKEEGIDFKREFDMPVYYKNKEIGLRRVDFLISGRISVELKALANLEDIHIAQALNYLEAYNVPTGLLINFGAKSLQYHRLYNKKYQNRS